MIFQSFSFLPEKLDFTPILIMLMAFSYLRI